MTVVLNIQWAMSDDVLNNTMIVQNHSHNEKAKSVYNWNVFNNCVYKMGGSQNWTLFLIDTNTRYKSSYYFTY